MSTPPRVQEKPMSMDHSGDQRPRCSCCGEFLGPEHTQRVATLSRTRDQRIVRCWPNEREQAEISNMLLEEAPMFSGVELAAVFPLRCLAWAEEKAALSLMDKRAESVPMDEDMWADA